MTVLYRIRRTGGLVLRYEVVRISEHRQEWVALCMTRWGAERLCEKAWILFG